MDEFSKALTKAKLDGQFPTGWGVETTQRLMDVAIARAGLFLTRKIRQRCVEESFRKTGKGYFRQKRVGKNSETFTLRKHRTYLEGVNVCTKMRASKGDELPQLVHVLKGDMHVFASRPMMPERLAMCEGYETGHIDVQLRHGVGCADYGTITRDCQKDQFNHYHTDNLPYLRARRSMFGIVSHYAFMTSLLAYKYARGQLSDKDERPADDISHAYPAE